MKLLSDAMVGRRNWLMTVVSMSEMVYNTSAGLRRHNKNATCGFYTIKITATYYYYTMRYGRKGKMPTVFHIGEE